MTLRAWLYRILFPVAKVYWFFRRPKAHGAGCIIEFNNKILVVRNTYGIRLWGFPGGGINNNESPEQAAKREAFEEVGIDVKNIRSLGQFDYTLHYRSGTVYIFTGNADSEIIKIDPNEILEARWVIYDDLSDLKFSSIARRMLEYYNNYRKNNG
jgi:mutator protein MutT